MRGVRRYIFGVVIVLSGIWGAWMVKDRNACLTETKLKTEDPAGFIFEVEYSNCDTLAKDEAIRVYARKVTPKRVWTFPGWQNKRTLLFRYDPGRWDNPLPSITRPSGSTILISIPEVSSIEYRNRKWEIMNINYAIGRVDYPAVSR